MITPNQHLIKIRDALASKGHSLWFVGGCVRDSLRGEEPKDIDLCTDATPDEAMAIYREHRIRYFETGLAHGTLTVRAGGESYEITTLRTESEHDGRRAVVAYTRDLHEDLSRRDLTINAMAQDFDGNIIDPFGGVSDLQNERVRVVGNAEERFKEDYLRILRYFRFHARFAGNTQFDTDSITAVCKTRDGLKNISGERKWLEMQKIIVGPFSAVTLGRMQSLGILQSIGIRNIDAIKAYQAELQGVSRPATMLGIILDKQIVDNVMRDWRMSNNERAEARFANGACKTGRDVQNYKEWLTDGADLEWVEQMLMYHNLPSLRDWDIPTFPLNGNDLMKKLQKQGPVIGQTMRHLRGLWKDSEFALTRDDLLATVR